MNAQEYKRTQKALDALNAIERSGQYESKTRKTVDKQEMMRLLRELHLALEEMFWAGDFKREEGNE